MAVSMRGHGPEATTLSNGRRLAFTGILIVLATLLLLGVVHSPHADRAEADSTFNASFSATYSSKAPLAAADITTTLNVPLGDLYPNLVVDFFPGASSIAAGGSMPAGEQVGTGTGYRAFGTFSAYFRSDVLGRGNLR